MFKNKGLFLFNLQSAIYILQSLVNTDGWESTQNAWKKLFPNISLILCFLHLIIGIKDHIRRDKVLLKSLSDKLWNIYKGSNKRQFSQRLRRFWEWSMKEILPSKVRSKIEKAKANSHQYQQGYNYSRCYRTSNQIDRKHELSRPNSLSNAIFSRVN